jgi:uncharacterized protein (DUF2236 family)
VLASPRQPELGLFGPASTTWRIDREVAVLLGSATRALMLQVAHPKVAAAVANHSRYRSDPLGRLRGTLDAIYGFTYSDMPGVERILGHIHHLHTRVHGRTPDGDPYSALDPHLLLWVYATLIDSSLLAYDTFVSPLSFSEREAYYAELRRAGPLWGIRASDFPDSLVDLRAWMAHLIASGEVRVSPQGRSVGHYILDSRVWWVPRPLELLLRELTVWLLPPPLRAGFGYTWGPHRELVMYRLAACSRAIVPRLPHIARDLPIARAAYARVRRSEARVAPAVAGSAARLPR